MMYIYRMDNYDKNLDNEIIRREIIKSKKKRMRNRRLIAASLALILTVSGAIALGKFIGSKAYDAYNKEPINILSDQPIVQAAEKGLGNKGGEPYWSWYGFGERVEWCACFASWAANEVGAIDAGNAPKFAYVPDGINWFTSRDQFIEPDQTPSSGDFIFFDWDQDGGRDHVGIVASVVDNKVFTIEGNSSDCCRVKVYDIADPVIFGYGHIES